LSHGGPAVAAMFVAASASNAPAKRHASVGSRSSIRKNQQALTPAERAALVKKCSDASSLATGTERREIKSVSDPTSASTFAETLVRVERRLPSHINANTSIRSGYSLPPVTPRSAPKASSRAARDLITKELEEREKLRQLSLMSEATWSSSSDATSTTCPTEGSSSPWTCDQFGRRVSSTDTIAMQSSVGDRCTFDGAGDYLDGFDGAGDDLDVADFEVGRAYYDYRSRLPCSPKEMMPRPPTTEMPQSRLFAGRSRPGTRPSTGLSNVRPDSAISVQSTGSRMSMPAEENTLPVMAGSAIGLKGRCSPEVS